MTKSISERELVLGILMEITRENTYSHIALRNVLDKYQYLDKKERAFITRVTEGTLEHMIEIDYIINLFSKVKVNKMKPVIRNIIRSAVYQLKYMDSVPNSAVCNEAVKLAVKKGFGSLRGFVNGVLRNIARNLDTIQYPDRSDLVSCLSVQYSMPEWILKKWLAVFDEETVENMLADFQKDKPITIRCNLHRISVEELQRKLQEEGAKAVAHPYLPYALSLSDYDYLRDLQSFRDGDFTVQDVSSMLVTEIADPQKGARVIDVCAAPGGKSIHMADRLEGSGHVEARDLTDYKVELIRENIARTAVTNVEARVWDATVTEEQSRGQADVVVADLPCSGLGVLGKKTDLKYKMSEETSEELVHLQRKILSVVQEYVKPGGTLIYSTCTINPMENQENVRWFLEQYPKFRLADIRDQLCEPLKNSVTEKGMLQLLPGVHESDGFFIAKLTARKNASVSSS
ncbi:16S rRNA (cytosine(967)-C(5))-methyltransferase RsmB [Hespellia stercorisuis]|uniref:16S rRNA (cytosine(967)-C(5))-methyltransferase n=1 Tax=Hespellia stercorisuis DSM 15480 TaxID=1121950 RepID=A0A1M6KL46_9FIRM|nr:16S rRNA (cytosine(967)-C(5))-methyltransferase RsmB [Hespellia stercorisuis]SHJ59580.1 16S rRNA (cytosine967-C5)-methyltransferase [Hespellia stercorisuis DSM 15480]